MTRLRRTSVALALLAGLAPAGFAHAQVRKQEPMDHSTAGTITVVDTAGGTVTVRDPEQQESTFRVDGDTTILEGGEAIGLDGLKAGDRVALDADDDEGLDHATYIEVVEAAKP